MLILIQTNNNLSKYEWKELSSGDDLNEILGHYRTANNDIVKSLLNLPSAVTTGEITVDWYPVSYTSNFGAQMLRWTQNGESTIFSRAKYGSSTKWGAWVEYVTKDDLGVAQYNAVGQISLSGKLSNIGEWVKNNGTPGKCTFVRVEPSDSDGYFGTSGFSILWMRTSVSYGWCILISDNPKMVVFGRNSTGWHWYAPSLTEVS